MTSGVWTDLACNDDDTCPSTAPHLHFARFLLPLPSYVPIPDGLEVLRVYEATDPERENATFTLTAIRQVEVDAPDSEHLASLAALAVLERLNISSSNSDGDRGGTLTVCMSVADVITTVASPEEPSSNWDGVMQNLGPTQDALMRSLHSARDLIRSVALTEQTRVILPTYERLPAIVMVATGSAPLVDDGLQFPGKDAWEFGGLMLLEHNNLPGWEITEEPTLTEIAGQSEYWARGIAAANPAVKARELLIQSRRLFIHDGDYALAVIVATTAIEVLLTSIVSALMWEECWTEISDQGPEGVASLFIEGRFINLINSTAVPRLGGSWSSKSCAWQRWIARCRTLRNRVVHGGHEPTRAEVQAAVDSVDVLQRFVFDRLAKRASIYPRVAMMLISEQGLRDREVWHGKLKKFAEEHADLEPPWLENFGSWHEAVVAAAE